MIPLGYHSFIAAPSLMPPTKNITPVGFKAYTLTEVVSAWEKLTGTNYDECLKVLRAQGVAFSFSLMGWRASTLEKTVTTTPPINVKSMLDGELGVLATEVLAKYVHRFLEQAFLLLGMGEAKVVVEAGVANFDKSIDHQYIGDVSHLIFNNVHIGAGKLYVKQGTPKPKPEKDMRVPLRAASWIGQPVFGSSKDSTYWVVALGKVNIAARRANPNGHTMSLRIEGDINNAMAKFLSSFFGFEVHFNKKGDFSHLSVHYDLNGVPATHVLGALFFADALDIKAHTSSLLAEDVMVGKMPAIYAPTEKD